jgi:UDP-glucuronate 4-epimerase
MKILITGHKGFIGGKLIEFIHKNYSTKIDFDGYELKDGYNVEDYNKLNDKFNKYKPDICINLAAKTGVRDGEDKPKIYIETNMVGLMNVVRVCNENDCRLIHFSSSSSLTTKSIYGITKLAGEKIIKNRSENYNIIRPFTIIGRNGRENMVINKWFSEYKKNQPISFYGDGKTSRGYTYIDDLLSGLFDVIKKGKKNKIYNIGGNQQVFLEELWDIFKSVFPDARRKKMMKPKCDQDHSLADITDAFNDLGWIPKHDVKEEMKKIWLSLKKDNT